MTGDEMWTYLYGLETKNQSMEWRHTSSLRPKKFKSQRSAQKVMVTAFWDDKSIILLDNHEIKVLLLFCLIFWNVAVP